jgi:O-antigen/teichoic acid export membrane protein
LVAATSRTVMLVGLLLGGVLFILAPQVIGILYGEAFLPAVTPLRLLVPGVILYSSSRILTQFYVGQLGRPGVASIISATTAIISLALYFTLVPRFGFTGAAIASSIAYTTNFIISSTLFWHATGMGATTVLIPTAAEVRRVRNTLGAVVRRIRPHSS